jgi:hypothetical protein
MDIHQDDKTSEILTRDVGLGVSGHRLCGGDLTLQGGKSNLGSIEVELQLPRLMGSHKKFL